MTISAYTITKPTIWILFLFIGITLMEKRNKWIAHTSDWFVLRKNCALLLICLFEPIINNWNFTIKGNLMCYAKYYIFGTGWNPNKWTGTSEAVDISTSANTTIDMEIDEMNDTTTCTTRLQTETDTCTSEMTIANITNSTDNFSLGEPSTGYESTNVTVLNPSTDLNEQTTSLAAASNAPESALSKLVTELTNTDATHQVNLKITATKSSGNTPSTTASWTKVLEKTTSFNRISSTPPPVLRIQPFDDSI